MELLGFVGCNELQYFEKAKEELHLGDDVIKIKKMKDTWTEICVDYSKFNFDEFFTYMRGNLGYGKFKPTHYECSNCGEINAINEGVSYCYVCNKQYIGVNKKLI